MTTIAKEITWIRRVLKDIDIEVQGIPSMFYDKKSAIFIATNNNFYERTKHIEMDCHYIREQYLQKNLLLPFVTSEYQLADFFSKLLPRPRFNFLLDKLSVLIS